MSSRELVIFKSRGEHTDAQTWEIIKAGVRSVDLKSTSSARILYSISRDRLVTVTKEEGTP